MDSDTVIKFPLHSSYIANGFIPRVRFNYKLNFEPHIVHTYSQVTCEGSYIAK